jgi:uncharacterized membrane protein YkvA (DUF1232 family)
VRWRRPEIAAHIPTTEDKMAIRLTVEISDEDLDYYRNVLDQSAQTAAGCDEAQFVEAARNRLEDARRSGISEGVRKRLDDLAALITMLEDKEWGIEGDDRRRILSVMSYFTNSLDVIPDAVPGLGYVDDALLIELILRELKDDLEGYRDFCAYREKQEQIRGTDDHLTREKWLAAKRKQMFLRIKRRRQERVRHGTIVSPTPALLAYRS